RLRPCRARLKLSSSGRSTRATPFSTTTRMFACSPCESVPRGPVTVTTFCSPTTTSTPAGISTGCFPIRLIASPASPHVGEDLPADALARSVPVRHHALVFADERATETTHHSRQLVPP